MSSAGRRSRDQAHTTRGKLLDAASRVFARDGYEAATVDDIVKDAGYSKGAFYVHFQTKEEVFLALLDARVTAQQQGPSDQPPPFLDSPQALYNALLLLVQPDAAWPPLFYEFCAHASRKPDIAGRLARLFQGQRDVLSATLRRGQEHGVVDPALDTKVAAAVLLAVVNGLPLQGRVDPQAMPGESVSAALASLLGAWLQPKAERPAPALAVPAGLGVALALDYDVVAEAYEKHLDKTTGPFVTPLLEVARLCAGQRVLDVATGTGAAARRAARLVGPTGYVVGVDRAPGMLEVARRVARSLGLGHVDLREMDATNLSLPDASFDVVLCAIGLAEFPAADRALREMVRVLVPDGRLVVSTWSTADRVDLEGMIERIAARHLSEGQAASGFSPFSYGVPQTLESALARAGLREVAVRRVKHTLELSNREEVWDVAHGASPRLHALLQKADPALREAVRQDILAEAERYLMGGKFRLTSEAVLGTGVK
ncbi:MAG: methyltransferase domain-containing protein [Chloroflexi bacterium]|nr:methyltransferase domain-containing protein [Chloroflexota bacterium]